MINGLSQTLVKIASPGVADFYQGSDLWDLRMVDPDNRGAIDFGRREAALRQVTELEGANRCLGKAGETCGNLALLLRAEQATQGLSADAGFSMTRSEK